MLILLLPIYIYIANIDIVNVDNDIADIDIAYMDIGYCHIDIANINIAGIDIATEAEPQATPAGTRRSGRDNRLSSNTKQLIRKMIFPIMTIIYTICICLLSKERGSNTIE